MAQPSFLCQTISDALRAFGQAQAIRVDPARPASLQEVDLLILGSPTQAMQSLLGTLSSQQLRGLTVACFDTRFRGFLWKNSAAPRMVKQLGQLRVKPIVPPESFFVKAMKKEGPLLAGEGERAASRALGIHQAYEAHVAHLAEY